MILTFLISIPLELSAFRSKLPPKPLTLTRAQIHTHTHTHGEHLYPDSYHTFYPFSCLSTRETLHWVCGLCTRVLYSALLPAVTLPGSTSGEEPICQWDPWVGKIFWRKTWKPTPCTLTWENLMNRGAWWATVHRVVKSQTQLKRLSTYRVSSDT